MSDSEAHIIDVARLDPEGLNAADSISGEGQCTYQGQLHEPHPTTLVLWGLCIAKIDVEIAPLILACWQLDLATFSSCQQNHGSVWIEFVTCRHAEQFLNIVARYEEDIESLYNRIRRAWSPADGDLKDAWQYSIHLKDWGVRQECDDAAGTDETFIGRHDFEFSCSVRFPVRDLPVVLERVQAEAKGALEGDWE